jgi:hypothetical protein
MVGVSGKNNRDEIDGYLYRKRFDSKIYTGKVLAQKFVQEKVWLKNLYRKNLAQKFIQEKFGSKIYTGKGLDQKFIQENFGSKIYTGKVCLKNVYRKRFGSKMPPYCRGFDITLRHTTLGTTPLDE